MKDIIRLKAYAKINLFLEVESKRADGYHNIESIFVRVSLHDNIWMVKNSKGIKVSIKDNSNLGRIPLKENLVYKACSIFFETFNINSGVEIYLEKNIPVGAGLGGGSSDCAAVLKGLSLLYPEIKNKGNIHDIASTLGSDVPFFMSDYSIARCYGRGEKIEKIDLQAKMPSILIVWPDLSISTADVYKNFKIASKKEISKNILNMTKFIGEFKKKGKEINFSKFLFNRFESYVFNKYPQVMRIKDLISFYSVPSLMSGSGSSLFALSYEKRKLTEVFNKISSLHKFIFLAKCI